MTSPTLALVGDYSHDVVAHRAIPRALEMIDARIAWRWVPTRVIGEARRDLCDSSGIWVVPASPYENMSGVLSAIQFARETKRPFLGTCGGFQHAIIEFARHVAGLTSADHAETNPTADVLVVTRLSCSLVEQTRPLRFTPGSRLAEIYGRETAEEGYRCNYRPNPVHRAALERAGLRFTAFDDQGEIRAGELHPSVHPFFIGTLFQPERAALRGEIPPLVRAFVSAVLQSDQLDRG